MNQLVSVFTLTSMTHNNQFLLQFSYSWNFPHRLARCYWYLRVLLLETIFVSALFGILLSMLRVVFPSFDNIRKSPAQIRSKLELMPSHQRADMCNISREAYCGTCECQGTVAISTHCPRSSRAAAISACNLAVGWWQLRWARPWDFKPLCKEHNSVCSQEWQPSQPPTEKR